jgi:hypothetical protein
LIIHVLSNVLVVTLVELLLVVLVVVLSRSLLVFHACSSIVVVFRHLLSNISELFLGIFNDSAGISVESFDLFVVVLDGLVDLVLVVLDAILPFLDSLLVFIFSSIVHFSEVLLVGFDFSMDLMKVTLELLSGISDVVMEASDDTQFIFESRRSFLEVFIEQLSESLLWAGSILGS